eukprot:4435136-Alexandrium_andersonii.AAC.1
MPFWRWVEAEGLEKLVVLSASARGAIDHAEWGYFAPSIAARLARWRRAPQVFPLATPPGTRSASPATAPVVPFVDLTGPGCTCKAELEQAMADRAAGDNAVEAMDSAVHSAIPADGGQTGGHAGTPSVGDIAPPPGPLAPSAVAVEPDQPDWFDCEDGDLAPEGLSDGACE